MAVSGSPPIQGAISDSVEYRYSYTLTDTVLCFTGAQVRHVLGFRFGFRCVGLRAWPQDLGACALACAA